MNELVEKHIKAGVYQNQDLLDRKIKINIDRFLKTRITPEIYFKYFYEESPLIKQYNFSQIQLPKINKIFIYVLNYT